MFQYLETEHLDSGPVLSRYWADNAITQFWSGSDLNSNENVYLFGMVLSRSEIIQIKISS